MSFLNSVVAPALFPSILWHTNHRSIHITFDDGPHPVATLKALETLKKRNIQATFFLVGANVERYPEIAAEIVRSGHTIGNHSQTHRPLIFKSLIQQRQEIQRANEVIEGTLHLRPSFFRPPFGYFDARTLRLARDENQKVVMWNVDAHDFSASPPDHIVAAVSKRARRGSIVLLHDNESTAGSLELYLSPLLERLSDRGFEFSALTI
jgi:peptidoglycan/xylan/chitin deacetylase (PgdA/CDA1 family)